MIECMSLEEAKEHSLKNTITTEYRPPLGTEAACIFISISKNTTPVEIFKNLTDISWLSNEDLYELGCYLKTYAEVHHC